MENIVRRQTISTDETTKKSYRVDKEQSILEHRGKSR